MFEFVVRKHQALLLILAVALTAGRAFLVAQEPDPEPVTTTRAEAAVPAVDLEKARSNQKLEAQALRNQAASKTNLSRIGQAVHSYRDRHPQHHFPTDIAGKAGKPLLSWRVTILPHIGEEKLYKEFKLDEPWNSKHNRKLLARMPDVFRSPRVRVKAKGNTVYQVFTGKDAVFGRGAGPVMIASFPDGLSNTILAVESSEAVPWTRPGGIPFDRTKKLPDFGKAYGKKPLAVIWDGSCRVLDLNKIQPETLKNAIDPMDGNVLGRDWE
jgi:hypothetical protein